jgi:photosystem II stability/assembly factor-like uncharacterized protein
MSDLREALDQRAARFRPTPDPWERMLRRARRRQRNRRIGAAVVALAVFAGTSFGIWRALQIDRSAPEPAIQPSKPTPTVVHSSSPPVAPSLPTFGITSLRMITPTVGWAMSQDTDVALSRVLRTTDGGVTWAEVTPTQIHGDRSGLTAFFLDESRAWVAWPHGPGPGPTTVSVFATSDGGRTWSPGKPFVAKPSWDGELDFVDARNGWAVATIVSALGNQAAEVWRTTDGGATWDVVSRSFTSFVPGLLPATPDALPCAGPVGFLDAQTGFVSSQCVNEAGLWVTHDGGNRWSMVPSKALRGAENLSGARFTSSTDGFLVKLAPQGQGASGLYLTHDGGRTWTLARLPVKVIDAGPTFVDPLHGWVFAGQDLYDTTDGGGTWESFTPDRNLSGTVLDFVDPLHGWAVSRDPFENPFLLATSDGGHTWVELQLKLAG